MDSDQDGAADDRGTVVRKGSSIVLAEEGYYVITGSMAYGPVIRVIGNAAAGIINGHPGNTFEPAGAATRAQAAKIIAFSAI